MSLSAVKTVALIGECMLEISLPQDLMSVDRVTTPLSYGGDTLNTAVYLARAGVTAQYITALGTDTLSDWMLQQWRNEGVACDYVRRIDGALPGLYAIQNELSGERQFHYWRDRAPVRQLLNGAEARTNLFDCLRGIDLIYLSGITLSLFKDDELAFLFKFLQDYKRGGGCIAFDSNFRAQRWLGLTRARSVFDQAYGLCDIALPTLEDEQALYPSLNETQLIERLCALGVKEIVVKNGALGCRVVTASESICVAAQRINGVVDTTAAGDSFNAAYLGARIKGLELKNAARCAHSMAAIVVQHRGAIVPRSAFDGLDNTEECDK